MHRFVSAVSLLILVGTLTACELPGDSAPPVALRLTDDASVEVLFLPCQGQLVTSVKITDPVDPGLEDPKDKTLWEISSKEGAPLEEVRVGEVPASFMESVPLDDDMPSSTELDVTVQSRLRGEDFSAGIVFTVKDLRKERVHTHKGLTSMAEFRRLRVCREKS